MKPLASILQRLLESQSGKILTHSGSIATVLGILTFYLLGFSPDPFIFELQKDLKLYESSNKAFNYYSDLNFNGVSEQITFNNGLGRNAFILVLIQDNIAVDQWNFVGSLNQETTGFFVGNFDRDSSKEIACFSVKENSIFLNVVEPFGKKTHLVKNRFIDTLWNSDYNPAFSINDLKFCDLNQDGFEEILFAVSAGNSRQPRKVYAYDIQNDSLWSSPISGMLFNDIIPFDIDQDGHPEIFCSTAGANNFPEGGIIYPDTVSWFVVFDDHLNYKQPPVKTGGIFSHTYPVFFTIDGKSALYLLEEGQRNYQSYLKWVVVKSDLTLKEADPAPFKTLLSAGRVCKSSDGLHYALLSSGGDVYFLINGNIEKLVKLGQVKDVFPIYNYQAGIPQLTFAVLQEGKQETMLFYDDAGKKSGVIELDPADVGYRLCWVGLVKGRYQLLLSGEKYDSWYTVRVNPWQYLQYAILIGLIAGFYLFISIIRYIQRQQLARQESMHKEILELQLKSAKNQLDPHFTFNALNALSSLSLAGDSEGVDKFIGYFSRLLRTYLNTTDQVLVSLREEIEFVLNYVELQRIRFDNSFRLDLQVSDEINLDRKIPKMLIQTHVENAIKHGLRPKTAAEGINDPVDTVRVHIKECNETLCIIIEDNGVGRGHSQVSKYESTGKGLQALDRIISNVKQLYRLEIRQEFEDLLDDDNHPLGTRVNIEINSF